MTATDRPDVTEMRAIHGVFRQTFQSAPRLVPAVAEGDVERAELVGSFVADVAEMLRLHHEGEDELMMPLLVERSADPDLVRRVAGQHHDVHGPLADVEAAAARWRTSASASDAATLVDALARLEAATVPHLDQEEELLLPVAAEHMSVEEWGALPAHAMQRFTGDMFLILGMVRDNMSDEQRSRMLAEMPPPLVEAWQNVGIEAYGAKVKALMAG